MGMEVHFSNPELQIKLEQWVSQTGRSVDELVENVMNGYFDELANTRNTLDTRYDEIKSGKVNLVPGVQAISRPREKVPPIDANSAHECWLQLSSRS